MLFPLTESLERNRQFQMSFVDTPLQRAQFVRYGAENLGVVAGVRRADHRNRRKIRFGQRQDQVGERRPIDVERGEPVADQVAPAGDPSENIRNRSITRAFAIFVWVGLKPYFGAR